VAPVPLVFRENTPDLGELANPSERKHEKNPRLLRTEIVRRHHAEIVVFLACDHPSVGHGSAASAFTSATVVLGSSPVVRST
jgi:hypothetical protein